MEDIRDIPLDLIEVPADRARDLDPVWAEALGASIAAQGLMHPISVRPAGERYRLVFGLHRFHAVVDLDWPSIPAKVSRAASDDEARLEEVMENLARHELIALDRCHHLFELKRVWERMHPQAAHGRAPKTQSLRLSSDAPEILGFARATAERVGLSQRAIQMAVTIWTRLSPASRQRLVGTDLARKQTELKALSEQKPAVQARILDLILGDAEPENVAQALEHLANGVSPTAGERKIAAGSRAIGSLDDPTLDAVLVLHRERIVNAVKRLGWV